MNGNEEGDGFIEFYVSEVLICLRRIYFRFKGYF